LYNEAISNGATRQQKFKANKNLAIAMMFKAQHLSTLPTEQKFAVAEVKDKRNSTPCWLDVVLFA